MIDDDECGAVGRISEKNRKNRGRNKKRSKLICQERRIWQEDGVVNSKNYETDEEKKEERFRRR
jgi:hypothetical protein